MKSLDLGQVKKTPFKDFLVIPLEKKWLLINDGNPIIFHAKLKLNGELVLASSLAKLASTKKVIANEI